MRFGKGQYQFTSKWWLGSPKCVRKFLDERLMCECGIAFKPTPQSSHFQVLVMTPEDIAAPIMDPVAVAPVPLPVAPIAATIAPVTSLPESQAVVNLVVQEHGMICKQLFLALGIQDVAQLVFLAGCVVTLIAFFIQRSMLTSKEPLLGAYT
eukprot:gnl/MRDRNA2_/MRDRNA2_205903_c0_seq1.p1 gnl/MRDRNA2_/MRDRNA2_205903_c0~~gnl/MRDRNA2_/MRDRNA2_205903_c0_seq1.p1  ORF type:complete len:152 (+),score=16.66 gnl/MRDRNA2_/MRDRNA2_205903_c0_seq1:1-456(+)